VAVDWSEIEGALNNAVAIEFAQAPAILVIYENTNDGDGTPVDLEGIDSSIAVTLLPANNVPIEVGSSGKQRAIGIYQIDIRVALTKGKYDMYQILDRLVSIFDRGTTVTYSGTTVRIVNMYPGPSLREDPHYRMPVTINWLSDN